MKNKKTIYLLIAIVMLTAKTQAQTNPFTLKQLIERSTTQSHQLKIKENQTQSAVLDRNKAYQAYLPKITAEASYTYLNDDIRLPSEMENLLTATQMLLIKEATAMKMAGMPVPANYKVGFATPYNIDTDPASVTLTKALQDNLKPIDPIQNRSILKANLSAQMLLFSGFKVPLSIKAANHQIRAYQILTEREQSSVIMEVATTYDKLAVIHKSEEALNQSENYLKEQSKYVEKAVKNGLALELDNQKIIMAQQIILAKKIELNANKQLLISKLTELTGIQEDSILMLNPVLEQFVITDETFNVKETREIKALNEGITALNYKEKSEYTEYIPKVVAFGKKELLTNDLSTFDPEWYVGVGLKWNIFDGFNAHNTAQHVKLEKQIMEEKRDEAMQLMDLNLKRIMYEYQKNNQLLEVSKMQIKTASLSFDLTKKQYESGLATMTDYLNSINMLEAAQLELIQNIYKQRASAFQWLDASGKLTIEIFN